MKGFYRRNSKVINILSIAVSIVLLVILIYGIYITEQERANEREQLIKLQSELKDELVEETDNIEDVEVIIEEDTSVSIEDNTFYITKEALDKEETLVLIDNVDVKNNKAISFTAEVEQMGLLRIGHGYEDYGASYVELDEEEIRIYNYTNESSVLASYEHGLHIFENVAVNIAVDENCAVTVEVTTSTGEYKTEAVPKWSGCNGAVYVTSVAGKLGKCRLEWTCSDLAQDIWVFGDSYLGYLYPNRFPYHLRTWGYDEWLGCGYPGAGAVQQIECFENLLQIDKPKIAVFTLGMNNVDTDVISTSWMKSVETFISLCEEHEIEPVLATIPSAWGSTSEDSNITMIRDNSLKNEWVRNSGYRFVDFERAVGAVGRNTWIAGMLSDDGVHPTELGAEALAKQFVLDVPEIVN